MLICLLMLKDRVLESLERLEHPKQEIWIYACLKDIWSLPDVDKEIRKISHEVNTLWPGRKP